MARRRITATIAELESTAFKTILLCSDIPLVNPRPENPQFTEGYEVLVALARQEARRLAERRFRINLVLYPRS